MARNSFEKMVLVTALCLQASAGGERWTRLQSAHFEVLTDASENRGREALRSVETIRKIVGAVTGEPLEPTKPVRLFLLDTVAKFTQFRPAEAENNAAGFYRSGKEFDYIVIKNTQEDLGRIVYHEYAHAAIRAAGAKVPGWFDEGLAELLSNATVRSGTVHVGMPIRAHVQTLRTQGLPDLAVLFIGAAHGEPFYAESWAVVRLLALEPEYRGRFSNFMMLLFAGESSAGALEKAFSKSLEQIAAEVRKSVVGRQPPAALFAAGEISAQPDFAVSHMEEVEVTLALAQLHLELQQTRAAGELLAAAPKGDGRIAEALGDVAMREGHPEEALREYNRAIALGGAGARVYFERAMLRRDDAEARPQVLEDLRSALRNEPNFPEARKWLEVLGRPAETTPIAPPSTRGWENEEGEHTLEGRLVELDCYGDTVVLIVHSEGHRVAMRISNPDRVLLRNRPGESITLNCGVLPAERVVVRYRGANEVTALRFEKE